MNFEISALLVAAYLLGAIPFGAMIAGRKGIDILSRGSGNIGATNVHRVMGKAAGLAVFSLDVLKGVVPALAARLMFKGEDFAQVLSFWTGMAAVFGHCFSPFLKFRGGKGISTGFGVLVGSTPWVALCAFVVFCLVTAATRYVSLASIVAAAAVVGAGFVVKDPAQMIWAYLALFVFVVYRHRGNIKRLLAGTERRFSLKGGTDPTPTEASGGMPKFENAPSKATEAKAAPAGDK